MSSTIEIAKPEPTSPEGEPSFRLTSIDVFNWGPFHGRHHCPIDPHGTAIIGPTGSGKTTLVDALMTLLAPFPKYNLASTGGHESDRDLISYIRGVSGVESGDAEASNVARPAKTLTGLAAGYTNRGETAVIGCLLWVDGTSNAAEDLKKMWFFARDIPDLLDTLLHLHHEGGKAAVTRHVGNTAGLRTWTSKKEYLAHVRGFFEVSENAFSLLNRAAGLKQINSIDQIFRELVLDDRSAFERALEVAREFDTLHGIYEELQTARLQRDSLLPVRQGQADWENATAKLINCRRLKDLLPIWFAEAAARLWLLEEERLTRERQELASKVIAAVEVEEECARRVESLSEEYLRHGGAAIQGIEEIIREKEKRAGEIEGFVRNYLSFAAQLGLAAEADEATFQANRKRLPEIRTAAEAARDTARTKAVHVTAELNQHRATERNLASEIQQVEARPNSNIPPPFQKFRELLGNELGLSSTDLPFVAEMVEVKTSERRWQEGIERAIGSERLRILVPAEHMRNALEWIDRRDNHLHVRLQSVAPVPVAARFLDDGFARKLDYRDHPFRDHVKVLISRRDRHCVGTIEALHRTEHAMTADGTMSDREGRFEKQDQKRPGTDWITGFDNCHLLASLRERHAHEVKTITTLNAQNNLHERAETAAGHKLLLISRFEVLEFNQIDTVTIAREIQQQRDRLSELTSPGSDAANAKVRRDEATGAAKEAKAEVSRLNKQLGSCEAALRSATDSLAEARMRSREGVAKEDRELAEKEFPLPEIASTSTLADVERSAIYRLDERTKRMEERKSEIEQRLVRSMSTAKNADTGALADAGTEMRDVAAYLRRLATLETEALPEKLKRFLDYLNQSSGQGVTQLLTSISNDVSFIQERVADLNATLSRVDFRHGQFLQLHAQAIVHPALQQMETAQRKLRHIVLSSSNDEGEAHFRALGEVVRLLRDAAEKRHTLGAQALLDPRHRLQFSVVEVDRITGRSSGARKGSQTGSGGEKEMMASYILTASLSYALCPAGAATPRYASIVLDEAFSKSSPAAASRIIQALRAFGLHPLFVTPNKEIALLKSHTRSAILVHNKNRRATLTSLTWEEIETHARARKAVDPAEPSFP
jgi:uncharacterized protein YPO0396